MEVFQIAEDLGLRDEDLFILMQEGATGREHHEAKARPEELLLPLGVPQTCAAQMMAADGVVCPVTVNPDPPSEVAKVFRNHPPIPDLPEPLIFAGLRALA